MKISGKISRVAADLGALRAQIATLERSHPRSGAARPDRLPTGFPDLDLALGGGWHAGALNELVVPAHEASGGDGVLEAFLPAFARSRLLAWIHPSRIPYPPALAQAGFDLARLLLVRPRDPREQGFALDLALRCGACDAVVTWLDAAESRASFRFDDGALRRLQLAAEQSGAFALCLRPAGGRWQERAPPPSPAAVRLEVAALPSEPAGSSRGARRRLRVVVLRCRGAAPLGGDSLVLEWSRDPLDESPLRARRASFLQGTG